MLKATQKSLSSVENQISLEGLVQEISQARQYIDVAEIIVNNIEEILAQTTQLRTHIKSDFAETAEEYLLRCISYILVSRNTNILDELVAWIQSPESQAISIHSFMQTIPLLKTTVIEYVGRNCRDVFPGTLVELATYFDRVIYFLDIPISNESSELINELNLPLDSTDRLKNLLERLGDLLDHSKQYVRLWLTSPHPDFGGKPPIFYLQQDKIEVVENLIEAIETGQIG